jgi:hypothetical protein
MATKGKSVLSLKKGILTGPAENDDLGEVIKKRDGPVLFFLDKTMAGQKKRRGDVRDAWLVVIFFWLLLL